MAGAGRYAVIGLSAVVVAVIVAALMILGSPVEARRLRMDEKRVADLQALAGMADAYRARHGRLPPALRELERDGSAQLRTRDPRTGQPYEYRVIDTVRYELCARFERSSAEAGADHVAFWYHGRGRTCFRVDARQPMRP